MDSATTRNNDGNFVIDDGTSFDSHGVAYTDPADLAESIDPADDYAEGWFTGFWHYGVAVFRSVRRRRLDR